MVTYVCKKKDDEYWMQTATASKKRFMWFEKMRKKVKKGSLRKRKNEADMFLNRIMRTI